jgi:excisionase family DNA binding protein
VPEDEPMMTKDEVAKLFRVDAGTVMRWVSSGELKAVRVGGTVRFNRLYIRELIGTEGDPTREG